MFLLHAKSMLIGLHVFYFSREVISFIIISLQQQSTPFDEDSRLPECGLYLYFIGLWQILGECFLHERISDIVLNEGLNCTT